MGAVTKELIGKEDFDFHNPATGTAAQTFNRTSSTGGAVAITKLSAQDIPLRDAVTVAGALTPFESLADSAAAKNVELALADVRRNIPHYKNFEYYGGSPVNDAATATKNTEVFQKIVTDIVAEGRFGAGVFFPGRRYVFKESAGAMPTVNGPNITLAGTGFGTILQREASASTALHMFNFIDASGARLADLKIDRVGIAGLGNAVNFTSTGLVQNIGDIYVLNCSIVGGASNVRVTLSGGNVATNVWISGCFFENASGANVGLSSSESVHVIGNNFGFIGTGYSQTSAGSVTDVLGDVEIVGNTFRGANSDININRSGVFSSIHRGLTISENKLTAGDIIVQGVDDVGMFGNNLYSGRIGLIFDMGTARNLRLVDNNVNAAVGNGITVQGITNTTLTGYQIRGGTISNATQRGIMLSFLGAPIRAGTISGVSIIDCSRQDGGVGTDFSGITLDAPNAGGGVQDSVISGNIIRSYSVTAPSGNMHNYAVEEVAGGVSNRNMIGPNFCKGYIQATENLVTGAVSLDVVVAVTAAVATYARFDGGAAV